MAARQRRRTTPRTALLSRLARWTALSICALALGLVLSEVLLQQAPVRASALADPEGARPALLAASEPAPARPIAAAAGPDGALAAELRAIVGRWIERAVRQTGGVKGQRLAARDCLVSVHVVDPAGGRELVALDADRSMRPASNLKLATTAAALVLLGADFQFETRFEAAGPIADGRLAGDLVVRAGGDPLWAPLGDGRAEGRLAELARALHARGLRAIEGAIVLDEGAFADPGPAPAWPDESQRWADYCALAGGLTVNAGILVADVRPGALGGAASVELHPRRTGIPEEIAVLTTAGAQNEVLVGATARAVVVRGRIGQKLADTRASFAHPDPVVLFGNVLATELARAGIELRGGLRRQRGAPAGQELAVLRSALVDCLVPINRDSTNSVADQVFLTTGWKAAGAGTRSGGRAATALALAKLGVPIQGLVQVDGSGLSRDNRITARQLTALLLGAARLSPEAARAFRDSLAVAGESGTLEDRLRGTPAAGRVRGKTGFIGGTSALSGIATTAAGGELVFSILVNYPEAGGLNTSCWKPMQDEIARALVGIRP